MSILKNSLLTTVALCAFAAAPVAAGTFQLQSVFDVNLRPAGPTTPQGPDSAMIDGSQFTLTAIFDNVTWTDPLSNNNLRAVATSVSVDVDRAGTGVDETIELTQSIGLFGGQNFGNGLFRSEPGSFFGFDDGVGFMIGDLIGAAKLDSDNPALDPLNTGAIGIEGAMLTFAELSTVEFYSGDGTVSIFSGKNDSNYIASGFVTNASIVGVAAVPLPAGLPLLLAGLAGLGLVRRKRKAA